nr:MAG TPA: hypothetical protein [Caudoviricetes sp.]
MTTFQPLNGDSIATAVTTALATIHGPMMPIPGAPPLA